MTTEEVKQWFKENLDRKMREFGLPHWRIDVVYEYDTSNDGLLKVRLHPERERACITVNLANYLAQEDWSTLESDVEHELMHMIHSPFDLVRHQLYSVLSQKKFDAFVALFEDCCEMTVRNMERMAFSLRQPKADEQ